MSEVDESSDGQEIGSDGQDHDTPVQPFNSRSRQRKGSEIPVMINQ
jgi:ribosomal protein L11